MGNEHIVHVIKKMRIFVTPTATNIGVEGFDTNHFATIYDGGIHLHTAYADTYEETLNKAVVWVFENFDIPESLSIRQELPELAEIVLKEKE